MLFATHPTLSHADALAEAAHQVFVAVGADLVRTCAEEYAELTLMPEPPPIEHEGYLVVKLGGDAGINEQLAYRREMDEAGKNDWLPADVKVHFEVTWYAPSAVTRNRTQLTASEQETLLQLLTQVVGDNILANDGDCWVEAKTRASTRVEALAAILPELAAGASRSSLQLSAGFREHSAAGSARTRLGCDGARLAPALHQSRAEPLERLRCVVQKLAAPVVAQQR